MQEYENMDTYEDQKHRIVCNLFPTLSKILWLRKIKEDFAPDYTISTLFSVNLINVFSGGKGKKIGIFHSPYKQGRSFGLLKYCASLFSYNFVYPWLDKLACVSTEVQESLRVFPLIQKKKIEVIYNIHNVADIITKSKQDIMTKAEKDIFSNPCLIYCGRMDANKAPTRALLAFAKSNRPDNAHIVFVGVDKGNLIPKLKEIASKYDISNKVHILGKKNNPYPYFLQAKALVSSSYSEGLPGVMIESLILGIPVVTTNSSKGIWEIFTASDQYDGQLDSVFENECGYISSNLAFSDKSKEDLDIANLMTSIDKVWHKNTVSVFNFKDKVLGDNIIKQLTRFQNEQYI